MITQKEKQIPVSSEYDVLIAGGGIAGISAALAAARNRAKVLLVERECLLGGLATLGLVTIFLPLCDGMGNQVTFGIGEELFRLSIKHFAEGRYPKAWLEGGSTEQRKKQRFMVQYNAHLFAVEAERLLLDAGVKILYYTLICDTVTDGNRISHVVVENKSGPSAIGVNTVIDCTGDADICHLSGEQTETFSDGNLLANWYYYTAGNSTHLSMLGFSESTDKQKPLVDRRFSGLDGEENSEMLTLAHQQFLKKVLLEREHDKSHIPVTFPTIPQLRMTRRISGAYTLDKSEYGKNFDDGIGLISSWKQPGPIYSIPFSTLHGRRVNNLAVAGRCISVTDAMWDLTRVIPACAVTGQAAGTAAALYPDFPTADIGKIRRQLTKDGVQCDLPT